MFIRKFASVLVVLSAVACGGGGYEGNYQPSFAPSAPLAQSAPVVQEPASASADKSLPFSYDMPNGFVRVANNDVMLLLSRSSDGAKIAVSPLPGLSVAEVVVAASITAIKEGCQVAQKIQPMNGGNGIYFTIFTCGGTAMTIVGQDVGGTSYLTLGNWPNINEESGLTARAFTLSLRPKRTY
jgi:hypothetical protein